MKGEEELSVICIKVVVARKGRDESAEGVVYTMKSKGLKTEPWGTPQEEEYQEDR